METILRWMGKVVAILIWIPISLLIVVVMAVWAPIAFVMHKYEQHKLEKNVREDRKL